MSFFKKIVIFVTYFVKGAAITYLAEVLWDPCHHQRALAGRRTPGQGSGSAPARWGRGGGMLESCS